MPVSDSASSGFRIGLISDTHGLLRPEALEALQGVDHLIHAGDIGSPSILETLSRMAPITAVRGNNDREAWAQDLPDAAWVCLAGVGIHVLHDIKELDKYPAPREASIIVAGHSHSPLIRSQAGLLHINPGSAGPRRFKLPVTLALLTILGEEPQAEIIRLL